MANYDFCMTWECIEPTPTGSLWDEHLICEPSEPAEDSSADPVES